MLRSSRTLPGQSYVMNQVSAGGATALSRLPFSAQNTRMKCSTMAGTSSLRVRSGGTSIGMTLSR